MKINVGDKVAFDVAWDARYGEVISIKKKPLFEKQLLIRLENASKDESDLDIVPASFCVKLTPDEYERLKKLSKNGKKC